MGTEVKFSPFLKQCFVTFGLTLLIAQFGLVLGFTSSLLPILRRNESEIHVDDSTGSLLAACPSITMIPTNLIVPLLMGTYGRKFTIITSIIPVTMGWLLIASANNITTLFIARLLQGFSLTIIALTVPVCIGEYTSPRNRGAFLTFCSTTMAASTLSAHAMGSYLEWRVIAMVCSLAAFVTLLIMIYSPESPSWLIDKGRYEEAKVVFRWLRENNEEDELVQMIEAHKSMNKPKLDSSVSTMKKVKILFKYFNKTIRKRVFYKPIFIMMHLSLLLQFSGIHILVAYAQDIYSSIIGGTSDIALIIISADALRVFSNICAIYIIKKMKRRSMLIVFVGLNVLSFYATAGYTFSREKNLLPFDHPSIGIFLIHLHFFCLGTGSIPLPVILAGELFPLEFRSLASVLSSFVGSPLCFLMMYSVPHMMKRIGVYGAYVLYGSLLGYSVGVTWWFMPETKDRTLQDIEDEFRGVKRETDECTQSLTEKS